MERYFFFPQVFIFFSSFFFFISFFFFNVLLIFKCWDGLSPNFFSGLHTPLKERKVPSEGSNGFGFGPGNALLRSENGKKDVNH